MWLNASTSASSPKIRQSVQDVEGHLKRSERAVQSNIKREFWPELRFPPINLWSVWRRYHNDHVIFDKEGE